MKKRISVIFSLLLVVLNVLLELNDKSIINNLIENISVMRTIYIILLCLFILCVQHNNKKIKVSRTYSIFISILFLLGKSYLINNSLYNIVYSYQNIVKSIILLIGYYLLVNSILKFINIVVNSDRDINILKKITNNKYYPIFIFVIILVINLPRLLISYPGYSCPDTWWQLSMYFQLSPWSQHHPVICTYIYGFIIKWVEIIFGEYEYGLFTIVILQNVCFAAVVAYGQKFLQDIYSKDWIKILILICCVVSPYYFGFLNLIIKDTFYFIGFILFFVEISYFLVLKNSYFTMSHIILLTVSTLMILSFRNDGIYLVLVMLIMIIVYFIKERELCLKKIAAFVLTILICIISTKTVSMIIVNNTKAYANSLANTLSLPLQQTARYVVKHHNEMAEEEIRIIDKVLDYDLIVESYNPMVSDPIKSIFKDCSNKDLMNYFVVWAKELIKDPFVYFDATLNQNYPLYYPGISNRQLLYYLDYQDDFSERMINYFEIDTTKINYKMQNDLRIIDNRLYNLPILAQLYNIPLLAITMLYLIGKSIKNKINSWYVLYSLFLINMLIVIASPVIYLQPRYAFPMVFSWPYLIATYQYFKNDSVTRGI